MRPYAAGAHRQAPNVMLSGAASSRPLKLKVGQRNQVTSFFVAQVQQEIDDNKYCASCQTNYETHDCATDNDIQDAADAIDKGEKAKAIEATTVAPNINNFV